MQTKKKVAQEQSLVGHPVDAQEHSRSQRIWAVNKYALLTEGKVWFIFASKVSSLIRASFISNFWCDTLNSSYTKI